MQEVLSATLSYCVLGNFHMFTDTSVQNVLLVFFVYTLVP